jgi:hypothetical protein
VLNAPKKIQRLQRYDRCVAVLLNAYNSSHLHASGQEHAFKICLCMSLEPDTHMPTMFGHVSNKVDACVAVTLCQHCVGMSRVLPQHANISVMTSIFGCEQQRQKTASRCYWTVVCNLQDSSTTGDCTKAYVQLPPQQSSTG